MSIMLSIASECSVLLVDFLDQNVFFFPHETCKIGTPGPGSQGTNGFASLLYYLLWNPVFKAGSRSAFTWGKLESMDVCQPGLAKCGECLFKILITFSGIANDYVSCDVEEWIDPAELMDYVEKH